VDPGDAARDDQAQAECAWGERGLFAAGALAVVPAAHDRVVAGVLGSLDVGVVDRAEGVLGHAGQAAPQGHAFGSGGHDLVGGDIVAEPEQQRHLQLVAEGAEVGQQNVAGPFDQFSRAVFGRWHKQVEGAGWRAGFGDARIGRVQGPWVGDHAGQRGCGSGFRAAQVDLIVGAARAPREIARHRSQAAPPGRRHLTHADASVAPGLVQAGSGP
jgi:hypothetical protein